MNSANFFQNEKGEYKVIQPPNLLLSLWLLTQAVNIIFFQLDQPALATIANLLLFAWAYDELTMGESPFRRTFGGVILLVIIITTFV